MKRFIIKPQPFCFHSLERGFAEWLQTLGYGLQVQKQHTNSISELLSKMEEAGICSIEKITSQHIKQYYAYLQRRPNLKRAGGLSSSTISKHISAIRLLFTHQEQMEKIKDNPMSSLSFRSAVSKPGEYFAPEEINQLYTASESYLDSALLSVFYGCGLRRSEVEKLNSKDINYQSGLLYVREGKGKKRRVIPMSVKVKEDLENYFCYERIARYQEESFFINQKGTRMRAQSFAEWFRKLKDKSGIEKNAGLHSLRHSIATHLLENGVKVEYVRDFLGHEFLETTQIYTKVSNKQLQELTPNVYQA